jgi:hypothetical protein
MSTISRRLPISNIARLKAINTFKTAYDATPSGTFTFPADVVTDLPVIQGNYQTNYYAVDTKESAVLQAIEGRKGFFGKLNLSVNHFLQVVRLTILRSVLFEDGNWQLSDENYYNLDSTGGNLPDINTEEDALIWANHVVQGEADRKVAKPAAPDMVNPTAAFVGTQIGPLQTAIGLVAAKTLELTTTRNQLNGLSVEADAFILKVWNFLDANTSGLEDSTRRNLLRQYGVVYISTGIPNIITAHLTKPDGTPLQGAEATIEQTGGSATSNSDGLVQISTNALGTLNVIVKFPGYAQLSASVTIPDNAEEQTFNLGTLQMSV